MYNVTDIISKPVINLYNGMSEGTVKNICFDIDLKKAEYLILFNDSEDEEVLLDITKVYNIGDSAITIKNNAGITPLIFAPRVTYNNPINNIVYNLEGNNLGNVKDIILNEKFKIDSIVVDSKEYLAKSVVSYNNDNLIINSSGIKFNKESHQPKTAKVKLNNLVTIMPKINLPKINFPKIEEVQPSVTESKPNYKISNNPLPQRVVSDQNYLIGRKVSKTVYGINNEIIIKKDNIITDKTIQNAKLHNKLVELAVFSKLKENI